MTSKEAIQRIKDDFEIKYDNLKNEKDRQNIIRLCEVIEKDLEILEILKRKGVSVGFIQLLIKENCGGVREYNDFIGGDKSLHLTANEYKKLKEWLENDK